MGLETISIDKLGLTAEQRLLDLGCGEGRHSILASLAAPVQVVAFDLSKDDLSTTRERFADFRDAENAHLDIVCGSGLTLPFADDTFDVVICAEVLEHIHEFEQVLKEIKRVLKPGGQLAVSVPRFLPEWVCWQLSSDYHEVPGGHVHIFRTSRLKNAIEAQRLVFKERHWAHALHVPYWWLRCLLWQRGESAWPVRTYHRLLVWDLMKGPWLTRWLDRLLNPLIGKSVVMYFDAPEQP